MNCTGRYAGFVAIELAPHGLNRVALRISRRERSALSSAARMGCSVAAQIIHLCASLLVLLCVSPDTCARGEASDRFDHYSVRPFIEIEPGFTSDPRQTFTLRLAGVGREPVEIVGMSINGRHLRSDAWRITRGTLYVNPPFDLRQGLNQVTLHYRHRADAKVAENKRDVAHTFFVNHQPLPVAVRFGERGELVIGNRARFVLGGYRSGQFDGFVQALPSAAAAGFDMVHDYSFESYSLAKHGVRRFLDEARQYLRRAKELDLGVFFGLPRSAVRSYDEETLSTIIAELAAEPSLWMWYIYDEPTPDVLDIETASKVYSLLKRLDPNRPAVLVTNRIRTLVQYYPFCDALWFDRYPIVATSGDLVSLAPIAASIGKARQVAAGKPVWPVLQVHDNKGLPALRKQNPLLPRPSDGNHRPNESELRAQSHLAIAEGSAALVFYWGPETWYSMQKDTPGVWRSLSRVLAELNELEAVLLSAEDVPEVGIDGGHDKIAVWTRKHGRRIYVGLANASVHTPGRLMVAAPSGYRPFRRFSGNGTVETSSEGAVVRLDGAGAVVLVADPQDR